MWYDFVWRKWLISWASESFTRENIEFFALFSPPALGRRHMCELREACKALMISACTWCRYKYGEK
jgi:hypothetical protein